MYFNQIKPFNTGDDYILRATCKNAALPYKKSFKFSVVNVPFICSNIPAASAYGVYISYLIRYSRDCGSYNDIL